MAIGNPTLGITAALMLAGTVQSGEFANLEKQFRELPMDARRLTGPLFWMHGDENETKERLEFYLEKVAEGGNGSFTAESRPHRDWLGPIWIDDRDDPPYIHNDGRDLFLLCNQGHLRPAASSLSVRSSAIPSRAPVMCLPISISPPPASSLKWMASDNITPKP